MTKLGNPINIRLSRASNLIYEAEAQAKEIPLRTYLRLVLEERLNRNDGDRDRNKDSYGAGNSYVKEMPKTRLEHSMLIEMLLLMRQISRYEAKELAHGEIERLGYDVWEMGVYNK